MRHLIAFVIVTTVAVMLPGEDVKPAAKPPEISDALKVSYFKARAENDEAQTRATQAAANLQAAVAEMQKVCPVILDNGGMPACVPMPAPPPPAAEKK